MGAMGVRSRSRDVTFKSLKKLGALGPETILAHGIWLDDEEYEIVKQTNTRITHNPSSNCKLASGICDVLRYQDMGVVVGIGTDGPPCNNNFDMFRDMLNQGDEE